MAYIGIILLLRIAQHISNKKASKLIDGPVLLVQYGAYWQLLSALFGLLLIFLAGNGFQINSKTVLISMFSGFTIAGTMTCSLLALKSSTMALISMSSAAGLLIPSVASVLFFGVPMKPLQWGGIIMLLVAAYFLVGSSRKIYDNFSIKTVLLLIGTMLCEGGTMLAQQLFSRYVPTGDVSVFSLLSFGVAGIIMLAALPVVSSRTDVRIRTLSRTLLLYGVILSLSVFLINQLATIAVAFISPIVLFAFANGGSMIIAALIAALIFHERLTVKSVLGVLIGIISLVIIKI